MDKQGKVVRLTRPAHIDLFGTDHFVVIRYVGDTREPNLHNIVSLHDFPCAYGRSIPFEAPYYKGHIHFAILNSIEVDSTNFEIVGEISQQDLADIKQRIRHFILS